MRFLYLHQDGRVVKALDLRSNGRMSAWVRTPLLVSDVFFPEPREMAGEGAGATRGRRPVRGGRGGPGSGGGAGGDRRAGRDGSGWAGPGYVRYQRLGRPCVYFFIYLFFFFNARTSA